MWCVMVVRLKMWYTSTFMRSSSERGRSIANKDGGFKCMHIWWSLMQNRQH